MKSVISPVMTVTAVLSTKVTAVLSHVLSLFAKQRYFIGEHMLL